MKFFIDSKTFFQRQEENNTMSISSLLTNEVLYFNATGKRILDYIDKWYDLKEVVKEFNYKSVPFERVYNDFSMLLYNLESHSVAKLSDIDEIIIDGCREVKLLEAKNLSKFLIDNMKADIGYTYVTNVAYYDFPNLYKRIDAPFHKYIIDAVGNKIIGACELSASEHDKFGNAVMLQSLIFDKTMSLHDCKESAKRMLDEVNNIYINEYHRVRYMYINKNQDSFIRFLEDLSFSKKACFKDELRDGRDLVLYDRDIS